MATIRGNNGNNALNGTNLNDYIDGFGGNDTLRGNGGNDTIQGGDGNDTAFGGDGNDIIRDASGFIHDFHGGNGNDELTVRLTVPYTDEEHTWKASLYGDAGDDVITALYNIADDDYLDNILNVVDGGTGNDIIFVRGASGSNHFSFASISTTIAGGNGDDQITALSYSWGASFNKINGDAGNDIIVSESATAQLYGGAGSDDISVISSFGTIDGGSGDDHITIDGMFPSYTGLGADFNQLIRGGDGYDTIFVTGEAPGTLGGVASATIFGDGGDDRISVRLESGSIYGGNTLTSIDGGVGNDVIVTTAIAQEGDSEGGQGRTKNIVLGNLGDDYIDATAMMSHSTDVENGGGPHIAQNFLYGGDGNDHLIARISFSSYREGMIGHNYLDGGTGNDVLEARSSRTNELYGGAGDDVLRVNGYGDSTLDGGAGNDRLYGDGGDTTFVLRRGEGRDVIYGYDAPYGEDHIALSGGLSFGSLQLVAQGGANTRILAGGVEIALVVGVTPDELSADDFILV